MNFQIPDQVKGGFSDTVSQRQHQSVESASLHYQQVKNRFLAINSWELRAGKLMGEFSLCDEQGAMKATVPKVNDFIRIKVPGWHNRRGNSYDWVKIEKVEEETSEHQEMMYIRARPSHHPKDPEQLTAHFFTAESTSNFLIKRIENEVFAEVHGRNEIPNVPHLTFWEKLRNGIVGFFAIIGGSKVQWKSLTDGLLGSDEV